MYHLFLGLDYLIGLMLVIKGVHLDLQATDKDWSRQSQITCCINCFFKTSKVQVSFHPFLPLFYPSYFQESPLVRWVASGPNLTTTPGNYNIQAKQSGKCLARKKFPAQNEVFRPFIKSGWSWTNFQSRQFVLF